MKRPLLAGIVVALICLGESVTFGPQPVLAAPAAQSPASDDAQIRTLLTQLERAFGGSDGDLYYELMTATSDRKRAEEFLAFEFRSGASRVVVIERDREHLNGTLPGSGYRLVVDALIEYGWRGRIATWQLDIKRIEGGGWRIADQDRLSAVVNLYRIALDTHQQFDARNLKIRAEDLDLTLIEGSVFKVEAVSRNIRRLERFPLQPRTFDIRMKPLIHSILALIGTGLFNPSISAVAGERSRTVIWARALNAPRLSWRT